MSLLPMTCLGQKAEQIPQLLHQARMMTGLKRFFPFSFTELWALPVCPFIADSFSLEI